MGQRRTEVVEAAIGLLDEVGLDGLTMRALASRLGVQAGALYRHYPSKQALLDAMAGHLIGRDVGGPMAGGTWDEMLRGMAIGSRELMLAHRDGARLFSTFSRPDPKALDAF